MYKFADCFGARSITTTNDDNDNDDDDDIDDGEMYVSDIDESVATRPCFTNSISAILSLA